LGPRIFVKSGFFDEEEEDGVDDLEGFFEAEEVFAELEDVAAEVAEDLELEEPATFEGLA
jgi:hypothetical protein